MAGPKYVREDPVVVVGFSFRFPQDTVSDDAFWKVISEGISTMTEVPETRYNANGHHDLDQARQDTVACRGGHYLTGDIAAFDAPFFAISSTEAKAMDPQLRLLLETSYHALESAGQPLEAVRGSSTSVFVGNLIAEYSSLYGNDDEINAKYQATGISSSMLSNRLSWFYDFRGPSISLDTACSSSLTGLHLACQSLLQGESEMSLVCGVQLQLEPRSMSVPLSRLNFLSPDSQCYSFDERANGYSRGEGVGVIVLKRLSKALENGDIIRAVIRGTAVNQDGRTPSISQPSSTAQAALIRKAYEKVGFDFHSTGYFEAHGTGTSLGDPIEAKGISLAFSEHRNLDNPLFVGSVKANIGHLEGTAGIAGLIKIILMLERAKVPPVALLNHLNPAIDADQWHLQFPMTAEDWRGDGLRRASANSFGFGGTNAHVVVDDALHYLQAAGLQGLHNTVSRNNNMYSSNEPLQLPGKCGVSKESPFLFVVSAADENGIQRQATALESHLHQIADASTQYLADLAFTLSNKRSRHPWKSFILSHSIEHLRRNLSGMTERPVRTSGSPTIQFVFTGQGAQWASMGTELLVYHIFRESLEQADSYFHSLGSTWSLLGELCASPSSSGINSPRLAQPLCTALQVALVDLLASWGVTPQAVVGHSSGEIAAAYCAGALTKESAWRVAYFRGETVVRLSADPHSVKGGMLAVGLSEVDLRPHIVAVVGEEDESILTCACINSCESTTVSGVETYIDKLAVRLQSNNIFARKLDVPVAYHSPQMLQVADSYTESLEGYLAPRSQTPSLSEPIFVSSVSRSIVPNEDLLQASYWVSNLVSRVRFSEAVELMVSSLSGQQSTGSRYMIEVGPHPTLRKPVQQILGDRKDYVYDHVLRRNTPSIKVAKEMVGRLTIHGYPVGIEAANSYPNSYRKPKMLVNLPHYSFNHLNTYWLESRLSRNLRFRETPRHELLGNPSTDWNPLEPKWRFTIRESDLPWIIDHKMDGMVLYPAAGMLAMVLEGARALTVENPTIIGYRLRDVSIMGALVIPLTEEGIETQLHMRPHARLVTDKGQPSWEFLIYSVTENEWKLHCSGQVSVVQHTATDLVSEGTTDSCFSKASNISFLEAGRRCRDKIDSVQFYKDLHKQGAHFGKSFQTVQEISVNAETSEAIGRVTFDKWTQLVKKHELRDHIIHPSTLDSLLHVLFAATRQSWHSLPTMFPTGFSDIYISCGLLGGLDEDSMLLYGKITDRGISYMNGDVTAMDSVTETPMVIFRGCRLSGFHIASQQRDKSPKLTTLFHQIQWKPDISLLSQHEIEEYCCQKTRGMPGQGIDRETEIICRHFMSNALEALPDDSVILKPDLQKYVQWARRFLKHEKGTTAELIEHWPGFDQDELRPRLISEYRASSPEKNNIVLFAENLLPILAGKTDPLDLMFNTGVAESLYQTPLFSLASHRLAAYMDLLAHKDSNINIIEVGAGTGGTTSVILDTLSSQGKFTGSSPRFNRYDFTDISPSFFVKAQGRYASLLSHMRFKTLDIGRDPAGQGFDLSSYDIVIAASVLHATANIEETLENVRKLLKPGGQLIFLEPTNHRMATIPCFSGVLPGWWLSSDDYRTSGPLLNKQSWKDALFRAGFDGLRISLSDDVEESHGMTLMVSSLPSSTQYVDNPRTVIITETAEQYDVAVALQKRLAPNFKNVCDIHSVESFALMSSAYEQCISLIELENPIMDQMTEVQFGALQRIVKASRKIFWVNDSSGEVPKRPESSMISGFGKTIMRETPDISFVHLNVHPGPTAVTDISRVVQQSCNVHPKQLETDLLEQSGTFYIPRVVEAPHINRLLDFENSGGLPETTAVFKERESTENPLELRFVPGQLDSFHFVSSPSPSLTLHDNEVQVLVKATGMNFKDVMVALNQVADDHIGQEFAGIVTWIGSASRTTFRPGDRVCGITDGSFRTYVRAKHSHLMKIPDYMPFTEASAIPVAYATAQYGICHLAQLKPNESILIHAAAGAVGQAAVQIAQHIGAIVYVTVSTPEKKQLLMERYGIEAQQFFSSRHISFAQQIMQRTRGKGVDVVLNSLSGQALTETWRCLATFGRFIEIGKRDITTFKSLPMEPFQRNVSFCSLDLAVVSKHNESLMEKIMHEVQSLALDESKTQYKAPYPLTVFKLSEFEEAFRLLQTGQHVGKVVVDWEREDIIKVIPKSELDYEFSSNATYLITGGLGGIGRSTAAWMSRHGARHLILLSRSGIKTQAARELVASLENNGVCVYAPRCDITDSDAVQAVFRHARTSMPPIKGCIHGSMVIENRIFQDYTLREFQASIDPKVRGTWNLHHNLPPDMDFFVILSSIAGIHGASSQSNYAAASSFLDAFARLRYSQGQPCISLDLGILDSIGYIAERIDAARVVAMTYTDHKYLREEDLHFMLKYACNPRRSVTSPWETQLIGALTTPAYVKRGGVVQDHGWMRMPMFCHLYQMEQDVESTSTTVQPDSSASQLGEAESLDKAAMVIATLLARRLARSLAVPVEDIDTNRPPHAFGVDSLVAVELVHWFSTEIRSEVPVVQILGNSTITQLGLLAAEKSDYILHRN
ncbi:hypothetical protein F5B20DRAFT_588940 [Whalleya microplaca]|nr:hypothetical protein F5B20DRAFT_588940 [Whalleya microplaca]